jgi:hypothetical protein
MIQRSASRWPAARLRTAGWVQVAPCGETRQAVVYNDGENGAGCYEIWHITENTRKILEHLTCTWCGSSHLSAFLFFSWNLWNLQAMASQFPTTSSRAVRYYEDERLGA